MQPVLDNHYFVTKLQIKAAILPTQSFLRKLRGAIIKAQKELQHSRQGAGELLGRQAPGQRPQGKPAVQRRKI